MNDAVKEAAGRYRQFHDCQSDAEMENPYDNERQRLSEGESLKFRDLYQLSNWAMRLADKTPIDEVWLRHIGLVEFPSPGNFGIGVRVDVRPGRNGSWIVEVEDTAIAILDTRGQLRCLCVGLDFKLKEQP